MAEIIESVIGNLNRAKQTAKGAAPNFTLTTVGSDRPKWFDGDLDPVKKLASEEYIDGQSFGSPATWTDTLGGEIGTLIAQMQPENVGLYVADILASDVVTGAGDPWTHTTTSGNGTQPYHAWAQQVGSAVGPSKLQYNDCKLSHLVLESGAEQKALHGDMTIMCLDPGQVYSTVPAKAENTSDPYLHTEASGTHSLDATVLCEVDSAILDIDRQQSVYYGDKITPCQIVDGKGVITATFVSVATGDTLLKRNKHLFNNTAPGVGDKPVKDVFYAALTKKFTRSATRTFEWTAPRVAIEGDGIRVPAQREGGTVPMTFTGRALKTGATPAVTTVTLSGDSTSYIA